MPSAATSDAEVERALAEAVDLHQAGRWPQAEALYLQVLGARPLDPRAAHNLGALYLQMGQPAQAADRLQAAVTAAPQQAHSWAAWISALAQSLRLDAAQQALAAFAAQGGSPDIAAEAAADLARVLSQNGRPEESAAAYRCALGLRPSDPDAMSNLAGALQRLNRGAEAEALYRQALQIDPEHGPALRNFAVLSRDSSDWRQARALYARAAALDGGLELALQAHLALAPIAASAADIPAQRDAYEQGVEALGAAQQAFAYAGEPLNLPWFNLAYHGRDDRVLLERTAQVLLAKVAGLAYHSPTLEAWRAPLGASRRIRVAFCSELLHDHTVGRLYSGFIEHLDRRRFEVVIVHGPQARTDAFRATLDAMADQTVDLAADLGEQRRQIEALGLDVLFFPDIGMSSATYFLAASRLAPVQAVGWGHPNTTGLPTLDYFISGDSVEAAGAEAHYGERLVRMRRLPCFYEPPQVPAPTTRRALGLPAQGALYGCPQTPFKFHPDFDAVLAEIAAGDANGHIVLVESPNGAWMEALRRRWAVEQPILLERTCFLPLMSRQDFLAHLGHIDVLLDPLHFGSGNTLYEAMAMGTPIVTSPGAFARGRIVAGAYAQMGVAEAPVAASPADYAALALALGGDPARRARLGADLRTAAAGALFGDLAAVRELEAFLTAAVEAAGRGERLASGWRPVSPESVR